MYESSLSDLAWAEQALMSIRARGESVRLASLRAARDRCFETAAALLEQYCVQVEQAEQRVAELKK